MLWRYAGIGFELAASIVGLTLLGLWIDYRYKTSPAGVLIGAGVGLVGGMYNFVRAAIRLGKEETEADCEDRRKRHDGSDERHGPDEPG